jgi:hypothetical protein
MKDSAEIISLLWGAVRQSPLDTSTNIWPILSGPDDD